MRDSVVAIVGQDVGDGLATHYQVSIAQPPRGLNVRGALAYRLVKAATIGGEGTRDGARFGHPLSCARR
jgi:hypothetical protein